MGNDIDWTQGHITPWWNSYDFKNINYRKGNTDTEQAKTWTNMGFCKENLYGSMYDASMEKPKCMFWDNTYVDKLE